MEYRYFPVGRILLWVMWFGIAFAVHLTHFNSSDKIISQYHYCLQYHYCPRPHAVRVQRIAVRRRRRWGGGGGQIENANVMRTLRRFPSVWACSFNGNLYIHVLIYKYYDECVASMETHSNWGEMPVPYTIGFCSDLYNATDCTRAAAPPPPPIRNE